jgi:hypothetical protein
MRMKYVMTTAFVIPLSGCMQYLVQPPEPSIAGSPKVVRVNSYFGSKVQQPALYVLARECRDGEQLARVQVRRDFGQGLISWLTLNLYSPATVIYECANVAEPGLGDSSTPPGTDR